MAAEGIVVVAPETADMQRDDQVQTGTHPLARGPDEVGRGGPCDDIAVYLDGHLDDLRDHLLDDLRDDLGKRATYTRCLGSCAFFFLCHALGELFLELCCCSRCLPCLEVSTPRHLAPENRTQKFFAFFAKNLSKLWVTTLLVLFIRWVLFRPIDVKPHLGTSAVHEFALLQSSSSSDDAADADAIAGLSAGGVPRLRFNLTAYLLFKNGHDYYDINYDNLAVSVLYAGEKIGPVDDELPSFKQHPHGTTVMRLAFVGQLRNASSTVAEMFFGDRDKGLFEMVVRIRVTLGYRSWPLKEEYFTIYDCPVSSPFPQVGEPALSSPAWCTANDI